MDVNIRILTPEDAESYRALRLRALREHPESFGSSYEEESRRSAEVYAERLKPSDDRFTLGAFDESGTLVGMVVFAREQMNKMRHKAKLFAMYVAPEARNRGVGRRLLGEILRRAGNLEGLEQIQLTVVSGNEAAKRLYRSAGFDTFAVERQALKMGDRYLDEEWMVCFLK
jgi:ribosomal protein S18 acetylase RimI-like enzyme